MKNGEINTKLMHIDIRYNFNKDNILKKRINLKYVDMENMLTDILTKFLNSTKILKFIILFLYKNLINKEKLLLLINYTIYLFILFYIFIMYIFHVILYICNLVKCIFIFYVN